MWLVEYGDSAEDLEREKVLTMGEVKGHQLFYGLSSGWTHGACSGSLTDKI